MRRKREIDPNAAEAFVNCPPQQWKPLEQFAMKLVIAFNDLCSENPA